MTTDTTETSHTHTDEVDVENSGLLGADVADETLDTDATETLAGDTDFIVPEEFEGNALFEGIDSQEKLFSAVAARVPDEYTFGEGITPEQATAITEQAKALDMTQSQVEKMIASEMHDAKSANDAMWSEVNKGVEGLRAEWGEGFDAKVAEANKAIKAFDTDGTVSQLLRDNPTIGSNPAFIKFFNKIHAQIDVDKFIDSEGSPKTMPTDDTGNTYFESYDKTM